MGRVKRPGEMKCLPVSIIVIIIIIVITMSFVVDWLIAEVLCLKQGGYGGRVHYFLKNAVLYIPLYGFYLGTVS